MEANQFLDQRAAQREALYAMGFSVAEAIDAGKVLTATFGEIEVNAFDATTGLMSVYALNRGQRNSALLVPSHDVAADESPEYLRQAIQALILEARGDVEKKSVGDASTFLESVVFPSCVEVSAAALLEALRSIIEETRGLLNVQRDDSNRCPTFGIAQVEPGLMVAALVPSAPNFSPHRIVPIASGSWPSAFIADFNVVAASEALTLIVGCDEQVRLRLVGNAVIVNGWKLEGYVVEA